MKGTGVHHDGVPVAVSSIHSAARFFRSRYRYVVLQLIAITCGFTLTKLIY
jgi:hypothetical protein